MQSTSPPAAAVALSGIARRFGSVQALDGVDLVVEPGEFFGLGVLFDGHHQAVFSDREANARRGDARAE